MIEKLVQINLVSQNARYYNKLSAPMIYGARYNCINMETSDFPIHMHASV